MPNEQVGSVAIIIRAKNNPMPAIFIDKFTVGKLKDFVILEGGTVSGATTVALHIKTEDGKSIIAETSKAIFDGCASALKGAEERFRAGLPIVPDMPIHEAINQIITMNEGNVITEKISDGKNTFDELYALLDEAKEVLKKECGDCGMDLEATKSHSAIIEKITKVLPW